MDIRNAQFHSQLQVSGVGQPINRTGSIISLTGEMIKDLMTLSPRVLADGHREIILIIRDKSFTSHKESLEAQNKIADVEAGLAPSIDDHSVPRENESPGNYCDRLVEQGLSQQTAEFLTADWFGLEKNPEVVNWLADPKAVRFRELNTRNEAFESAAPTEYTTLCHYVVSTYPNMIANLTFRKA